MLNDEVNRSRARAKSNWRKITTEKGLYQYAPSAVYFARIRRGGRLHRESLRTRDLAVARRLLRDLKQKLDRTNPQYGRVSFCTWLEEHYLPTLRGAESTLVGKRRIIEKVRATWLKARTAPLTELRPSEVEAWLVQQFGGWTSGYYNSAVAVIKGALEMAVNDKAICENPAVKLKYRRRTRPIRLTPSFEQFQSIVANVREQRFNADCRESADFLEAMGLLGLGQAELAGMKREHVDLPSGRIAIYRRKTAQAFTIPIFPQAQALIQKLCTGKRPNEYLFGVADARKALRHACQRLELPLFTQRSLRRMFIVRAIERGVDIKVIAQWQGHSDGGKLILDTYSFVRPIHSQRMAQLMTTEVPENVLPMDALKSFS